jgi:hypothetical protein
VLVTLATLVIGIAALITIHRSQHPLPAAPVNLVSISFVGYSTNAAGQQCVAYRLENHSSENLLALAELLNTPPGSGVFAPLARDRSQMIELAPPAGTGVYKLQVSCFAEDRGLLTRVYEFVQRLRRKPAHKVTKLLYTLSGPVVEPH